MTVVSLALSCGSAFLMIVNILFKKIPDFEEGKIIIEKKKKA